MALSRHKAFELVKEKKIASLDVHYQEYRHVGTGAQHIHLSSSSDENVFMAAFRTVPENSTGVAHILEHIALCGSKNYPVNDPFMSMTSRSLNTFMNAFTSSDWTAYPFATLNKKDFSNLLSVYLDAVFNPTLDPLAFAQEGHRVEFSEAGNPDSDLVFKGVVFNEMKGALSADHELLSEAVNKNLYRTVTNHFNSGGDPEDIVNLSYQELQDFYQSHYHPSNSMLFTFGNIDAETHHQAFEQLALHRFTRQSETINVAKEQRYTEPQYRQCDYPIAENADEDDKTYHTMSWLLGESTDVEQLVNYQLLVRLLVGSSAAPLRKALENSGLGKTMAPVSAISSAAKEVAFTVGLAGSNLSQVNQFETVVLDTLNDIVENGLSDDFVQGCLHQFELSQREISGGQMPYGLQLLLQSLDVVNHYGDGLAILDFDPILENLQQKVKEPDFIKSLVKALLVDNNHRVCLSMTPSKSLAKEKINSEKQKLAQMKADLTDTEKQQVIDNAAALLARQKSDENREVLPKVTQKDIASTIRTSSPALQENDKLSLTAYDAGTNGLVYQQVIVNLTTLSADEMSLLPLYTSMLSNLGVGNDDFLATQLRKAAIIGKFFVSPLFVTDKDDANKVQAKIVFSANGLVKNQSAIAEFLQEAIETARFDELQRIAKLVSLIRNNLARSVTQNGQKLAMASASSSLTRTGFIFDKLSGMALVKTVNELEKSLSNDDVLKTLASSLQQLHRKVAAQSRQVLIVGEKSRLNDFAQVANSVFTSPVQETTSHFEYDCEKVPSQIAWVTNSQVNFCAKAIPTVSYSHPDAAKLTVLGKLLKNNFLHQVIREQGGAYGSGAIQDNETGTFRMFSYRDPRLEETLNDFDSIGQWIADNELTQSMIEEATLGVIAEIDKPSSPSGQAIEDFENSLFGYTPEAIECYRKRVLSVTQEDLKHVAKTYLTKNNAATAVITNAESAEKLSFKIIEL